METWTNIKFDPPLNDALFSVEPPAGYQSQPALPVNFNLTPAEFTAKFLKIYADHMGGEFPPRLQDAMKLLSEKIKPKDATTPPTEEATQAFAEMMRHYPGLTVAKFKQAMVFSPASMDRMARHLQSLGLAE